ncbi:MAG: ribosomal L7Ae/L30e/S12e/Gadd45 family protein [Clostridiales bacterium]|jgi:ribosomal protein L7Ae-like RNA K-turn-binding protein|nr:ribosomal L7Ae/L30e/S12e/Gadd45 family protein [Clostridiales bacterium]
MNKQKIASAIALCTRAGGLVTGGDTTHSAIAAGKVKLVIVSADAAKNTVKRFTDKTNFYKVPFVRYGTKPELGKLTGGAERERSVLGVLSGEFAGMILKGLDEN